jgi:hypothetical protein
MLQPKFSLSYLLLNLHVIFYSSSDFRVMEQRLELHFILLDIFQMKSVKNDDYKDFFFLPTS